MNLIKQLKLKSKINKITLWLYKQRVIFKFSFVKTAIVLFCAGFAFFGSNLITQAVTKNWDFSTPSDYTYDNTKIEISSGQTQLKATGSPAWYNTSWTKRKPITINNTANASDLTDYQVQADITYDIAMQADFDDVRFTDSDGVTLLDHWLQIKTDSTTATFWVEVPTISALNNKIIYMYYGNSSASSASNGSNTFNFFDDFETPASYEEIFNLFNGKPWDRYSGNPILSKSVSGWDSFGLRDPKLMTDINGMLVTEGGQYIMYFTGFELASPHYNRAIGRATSPDGITWTKYAGNPVLSNGSPGSWDYFGTQLGNIIKRGTDDYVMYYSGVGDWDAWGVGMATSTDGITWTKYAGNPILMNTDFNLAGNNILTFPNATKLSNGNWVMYLGGTYSVDGFNIFAAQSSDGITWTVLNSGNTVLAHSPGQWDDDNMEDPNLIEVANGQYVMFYQGGNNTAQTGIELGIATSTDLINWTKYSNNPVMSGVAVGLWDGWRVENMFVAKDDIGTDTIRMWYSGTPSQDGEYNSAIGYATSDQTLTDYFSKWDTVGTVTKTTAVDGGSRVASLKGNNSHSSSLINHTDTFSNFILEAKVKPTVDNSSTCGPYFNFRYTNSSNRYFTLLRGEPTNDLYLRRVQSDASFISTGYAFDYGVQYYNYKSIFNGTKIDAYLDDTHIIDYTDTGSGITSGKIGIYNYFTTDAAYFDDVRVRQYTSPEPSVVIGSSVNIFDSDNPNIRPSAGQTFTSLSGFSEIATKNGGEVKYQLSNDNGSTCYWYNSGWQSTISGYSEANMATDINSNIYSLPLGSGGFLFKSYLHSDGTQLVQLDSVSLNYINDTTPPVNVGISSVATTTDSTSQLTVTAEIATDSDSGLAATPYWFVETSGNPGATSSVDWQASQIFVDMGLSCDKQYTYKVKVKDASGNVSDYSSTVSATTDACGTGGRLITSLSSDMSVQQKSALIAKIKQQLIALITQLIQMLSLQVESMK